MTAKQILITSAIMIISIASLALIGLYINIPFLKSLNTDPHSMKMNAIVSFFLGGIVLLILNKKKDQNNFKIIGEILSVLIFAISAITILEYITGIHFNIDELLIKDTDAIKYFNFAGRMAPGTVLNFLLLSIALILKINNKMLVLVQWIAFFIFLISFFAILCKIYNVEYFSFIEQISLLPTNSSICFLVFSTSIAFSNPHLGIIKIMYSTTPIGVTARRIIPAVVIIPIVSGFFRLKGEELGYFDTRYGLAVFSFSNITGLLLISYFGLKKIAINEQLLIHSKKN